MPFDDVDVKQLKLDRSLFQVILHYLYHLCRRYIGYQRKLLDDLILFDDGMKIQDSFIPYEYLVTVSDEQMILLAKMEKDKIVPSDNLICLTFSQKIDPKIIQNNLYYHLKYNKISLEVMTFKTLRSKNLPSNQDDKNKNQELNVEWKLLRFPFWDNPVTNDTRASINHQENGWPYDEFL